MGIFLTSCATAPVAEKDESAAEAPRYLRYIVQRGDTFWKIAQMAYNDSREWDKIFAANCDRVKDIHSLKPGDIIVIPVK